MWEAEGSLSLVCPFQCQPVDDGGGSTEKASLAAARSRLRRLPFSYPCHHLPSLTFFSSFSFSSGGVTEVVPVSSVRMGAANSDDGDGAGWKRVGRGWEKEKVDGRPCTLRRRLPTVEPREEEESEVEDEDDEHDDEEE